MAEPAITAEGNGGKWEVGEVTMLAAFLVLVVIFLSRLIWDTIWAYKTYRDIQQCYMSQKEIYLLDLPPVARNLLYDEAERERNIKVEPPWKPTMGWGVPGSEFEGINFQSAVLESVFVIEQNAKAVDATLGTSPPETAGAYLRRLQNRFPALNTEDINTYARFYDLAREPNVSAPLSGDDYRNFVPALLSINRALKAA